MNPPAEQLIRDYLNRLSVAARGELGFADRQSLLDRIRARIEAECGGINGASAVQVRKALADLGDPIVLVELAVGQPVSGTSASDGRYELSVAGNGNREMAGEQAHAGEAVKGSEIGEDLLVTSGPNGSRPGRGGASIRSVMAGLAAVPGRRRRASTPSAGEPSARDASRGGSDAGRGGVSGGARVSGGSGVSSGSRAPGGPSAGAGGGSGGRPGGTPGQGPRRPSSVPSSQPQPAESTSVGTGVLGRLSRGVVAAARNHTLEVLAIVLLGVGGAAYPPIWLVGAGLALPSKKWDIRDKFFGITLPVFLLIIGTVLIIVFGGPHASIGAYAYEAWLGAERLSRVLAAVGAIYLAWGLRRGRRQPKQPPWNVPHRIG